MIAMMDSLRNILVMIELEARRIRHDRTELYVRAVQPVLWLVIYGSVMSSVKLIPTGGMSYIAYITPGVLLQSTAFVSIFFGLTIVWEKESGILKKLLVTPASRYSIVIGRSMAAGVRSILQAVIIIPIAMLIGVAFIPNPAYFILAFALIFLISAGFAAISIFIASFLKTRERFMGIGQAITFPLFFASNALYPIELMPPLLKEFALVNPMSYAVDAIRGLLISGNISNLAFDISAITIFVVVMLAIASVSFKRIIE
ncbi:MAG: ABC transporter permease [Candidatus Aenigmarchaeota archaeon]|nr:ABC transporter permease [Candidatus Aenigmarchaeota archaeon]